MLKKREIKITDEKLQKKKNRKKFLFIKNNHYSGWEGKKYFFVYCFV